MKKYSRVFSLLLALMLCVSLLPVGAAALDIPDMDVLQSVVDAVAESEEAEDGEAVEESIAITAETGEASETLEAASLVAIDETNFPDDNFRGYVAENCDTDGDGFLSAAEIAAVKEIICSGRGIRTLKGVGFFTALTKLNCWNNELTELDVSKNTVLKFLYCSRNKLTELDVSKNTALVDLSCGENALTALDVSNNTKLYGLACNDNALTELDVSKNTALEELNCSNNALAKLDVSNCTLLGFLNCDENVLTELSVGRNTNLYGLECGDNALSTLDVSRCTAIEWLYCAGNALTVLDVSKNDVLEDLDCRENALTSLDVSKNTALKFLYCSDNELTALILGGNTDLYALNCGNNALTNLELSVLANISSLTCDEAAIGGISLTATEDGYTADFSAIAHMIDSDWVVGAGEDQWSPSIDSVYDAETGMATFASRPAVVSFGILGDDFWWDARIAIYVDDSDLPQLGMVKDMAWGIKYEQASGSESGNETVVAVVYPGMMSWKAQDVVDTQCDMRSVLYKIENGIPKEIKSSVWTATDYEDGGSSCNVYDFVADDPESGEYYFTVQCLGDGTTCRDGEIAKSDVLNYTKPDEELGNCSDAKWSTTGLALWSDPEDAEFVGDYEIECYYASTKDADGYKCYVGRGCDVDTKMDMDYVAGEIGSGYYWFRVRPLSSDITQCCNGGWSEFSERRYFWGDNEDHLVGDLDEDGYVLANDLVLLMKRLVRGDIDGGVNPDINGDGNFDILDIIRLVQVIANQA